MIKRKILIVAPYPIVKPYHGGQKRARALFEFYKSVFHDARYVGVFHRGQYPDLSSEDIPLGQTDVIEEVDKKPFAAELISGKAIDNDIHVRSHVAKVLIEFNPDIIHIEQPYPYLGLEILLSELKKKPKLIFGSQNIEYILKDRIAQELNVPSKVRHELVQQTKELEIRLSKKADLVITVNNEDQKSHQEMGAKRCRVIPNGIDKKVPSKKAIDYWQRYKKNNKVEKIITFVGSGHPPNWEGFLEMVGSDLSFIPQNSRMVIAGGVADYFKNLFKDKGKYAEFWSKVYLTGMIEDDLLAGLLETTDVVILPITTKRGSNLKTAEALLWRKKIVATSNTFQGFETYRNLPNIFIADSNKKFMQAILSALQTTYMPLSREQIKLTEQVQWKFCLAPLENEVDRLVKSKPTKFIINLLHTLTALQKRAK